MEQVDHIAFEDDPDYFIKLIGHDLMVSLE